MLLYLLKRLALIVPTLVGIMLVNFLIIQLVPGGPLEQFMADFHQQVNSLSSSSSQGALETGGSESGTMGRLEDGSSENQTSSSVYRGRAALEDELLKKMEKQYGLDKPLPTQFFIMMKNYFSFNFGDSFFRDRSVINLVLDKMPVSISLGLWSGMIIYFISIPLGIIKATKDGTKFDITTSTLITIAYSIPSFLFALLLIIVFSGGYYLDWFPLRGIVSENFDELSTFQKIIDYFHHIALPTFATVISGFAGLTMLTKNSFIDQINLQYVTAIRARGFSENTILYRHIFRNAMLIVISVTPTMFISLFFTSSLLIEVIFSLDGLGLLGFESVLKHDYPVIFGTLFFFSLLGLLLKLVSDFTYIWIDPRIDFNARIG